MRQLHLLETSHGTRYWRYTDDDSDDARSSDLVQSIDVPDYDVEWIGDEWNRGRDIEEVEILALLFPSLPPPIFFNANEGDER